MSMQKLTALLALLFALGLSQPATSAPMPPPGTQPTGKDLADIRAGLETLQIDIANLKKALADRPLLLPLIPDVEIYAKALDWPLRYGETIDVKKARQAILDGRARAAALAKSQAPWLKENAPRAYLSKIDGSLQPYILHLPKNFDPAAKRKYRLDIFFHGRGERLMELEFIAGRQPDAPTAPPDENRFLLYTYGRYCNANKFAGEIDTFEALADVMKRYPIDQDRIVVTGFSMGGAACWHHAVHYADRFVAASPGAGFAETRYYQKMDDSGVWAELPPWRKKLFHLYDCPDWALNLTMLPTIAYAGDLDKQKASGDLMEKACAALGFKLDRVGAPNTPHKYSPEAKATIAARINELAVKGRDPLPEKIRFVTYTLRYNKMHWITVDGLEEHFQPARIEATLDKKTGKINITTTNTTRLTVNLPKGALPAKVVPEITIDGSPRTAAPVDPAGNDPIEHLLYTRTFEKIDGQWKESIAPAKPELRKSPGLQGPIDDAFLDSFLIVRPTGKALNPAVGQWAKQELEYAVDQWRKIFRGDARIKDDKEITDADIAAHNLILFGDPSSNAILAKIADKLPIAWTAKSISAGKQMFASDGHALIMVYPNPLNPGRYVVLNSGFTFRQADHRTNSLQVAKLPDYAVINLSQKPDDNAPGKISAAGFFDERWRLPAK